jgi:predicted nucleotidyltransferase
MEAYNNKIRLSGEYQSTIKKLAKKYFNSGNVKIFGSRTDLSKRGGDIDIFIQTDKRKDILKLKIAFLRDFELEHGEQKIDLIVQSGNEEKNIYTIARSEGISL